MYGSTISRREVLRRSRLFASLGDGELNSILAHAMVRRYEEGDEIFAKGDPGNSMMAVLRGRITITVPSADGRQVVLSTMREGDVFGEIALLDGKERTADATAAADCELLVVPRQSLLSLLDRHPGLFMDFLIVLCERLRRTNEQVEDLAFLDLGARLAKALLRLENDNDPAAGLKISQRALGEIVGSSRESVNKHLQDWKRSGIIAIERGSIVIRDREALAALG